MEKKIVTNKDYEWLKGQFMVDRFLKFIIDKHEVFIGLLSFEKDMILRYTVIVDGEIQTSEEEWGHIAEKSKFSRKYIKTCEKIYGKKVCKERGIYEKYSYVLPWFPSFSALKKMLKKHNEVICLGENRYIRLIGGN
ncbi:hypothetical protein [Fusobacterium vincentii]|uniref:hypothetical protein n=1 Tax=Fusobacterium vincentii TaxID=155615 RepID=UPI0030D32AB4